MLHKCMRLHLVSVIIGQHYRKFLHYNKCMPDLEYIILE